MALTDLPFPVFLDIVLLLTPADILRCRRVCSDWRQALTRQDLCVSLVLAHFPRAREARLLRRWLADGDTRPDGYQDGLDETDWAAVYARLARRYFHLGAARPRSVTKVPSLKESKALWGVAPWNRFLKLESKAAEFQHWDPVWTFAPEEGLLVYPAAGSDDGKQWRYRARHLETGVEVDVPFDTDKKIVRRVRISDSVLLFEWCEERGSHPLSTTETAHRHYATAYDLVRHGPSVLLPRRDAATGPRRRSCYSFTLRAEWKIHFLGMPLSHQDRFFSTHNRSHYAVYIWQPTRSPWGEDGPLERLVVWELPPAKPHRPPVGRHGRAPDCGDDGPRVLLRLVNADLETWGVRQRDTPSLQNLFLDTTTWDDTTQTACGHVYVVEETHRWAAGPHSSHTPPRLHRVQATAIPLVGYGPRYLEECDATGRLCVSCWNRTTTCIRQNGRGPPTKPTLAPCWRHDDFPFVTVSQVLDADAGVRISARQCFKLRRLSVQIPPETRRVFENDHQRERDKRPRSGGWEITRAHFAGMTEWSDMEIEALEGMHERLDGPNRKDEVPFSNNLWNSLLGKGFISGSERWVVGEDAVGDITVVCF
ncbi:hypothetical protein B0T10DRAFT_555857 [Thelonectria olida]|uniref:F-box domain-containing protein n=1 Tax=Thelonectria olida TaxID=1576542 RepID=A0A9P9AWC4_9HYPO|nr:hypothetical protein B0T10DRAFT_555857 [Thelonectria olida]